jgi:GAF domain-containing protein
MYGRALVDRQTIHIKDFAEAVETEFPEHRERQRLTGIRTFLATPLLRESVPIGVIAIRRTEVRPFSDTQIALLKSFADQAVIAENVRLFAELQENNLALTAAHAQVTESLEQQTATSEILRVIASSPTDVQPVFETIADGAARLCEADFSVVARLNGGLLHLVALNMSPEERVAYQSLFPRPPGRHFVMGCAVVDGRPVHIEDVQADPAYDPRTLEVLQRAAAYRTVLGVPILRNGVPIGVIACGRRAVRPFTPAQIDLVKTFADQAVIAIENVRLFNETKEALEQQTATSEILRVIASSPTICSRSRPWRERRQGAGRRTRRSSSGGSTSVVARQNDTRYVTIGHHPRQSRHRGRTGLGRSTDGPRRGHPGGRGGVPGQRVPHERGRVRDPDHAGDTAAA